MEKDVVLIDELIGEHKAIMQGARNLEQVAGDAEAIASLSEAKETFMPGRFGQEPGLTSIETAAVPSMVTSR